MEHYIDITLLPDPEFPTTVLMNAIYTKLHKALCGLHSTAIGVSFPNYNLTLGNKLRLHATTETLESLQSQNWIGGMSGYCQINEIRPVSSDVRFRTVSRTQPKMSPAKLRRLIKRESITEAQAKSYQAKMLTKGLDAPYLELVSASNGQRHRRYIELGPLQDNPIEGAFDQFGLSKTATIPWFE
jgi:CRISPR-associated endonuclease Csy4